MFRRLHAALLIMPILGSFVASSAYGQEAFKIGGKSTSLQEVYKEDQASFYEIEKKKFELIDRIAREKYLDYFWENRAKQNGSSVQAAREDYEKKNLKISEKEVEETLEKFKEHPSLAKLSKEEQIKQIREFLVERTRRELYDGIINAGLQKGELVISFQEPEEPIYEVKVTNADYVRYGPEPDDTKPTGCSGDSCAITVVEYSEFQCPFCVKVLPDVKRIMTEFRGKIRWVVRDFPLSFHDRARPAAIAAHCAGKQGKYWNMYSELFANQRNLSDEDINNYAKKIGVDMGKYNACVKSPADVEARIDANFDSGAKLGVSGTPAFFINGRRLSGAMPYSEFKRIIDDELSGKKKS